MWSRAAVVLLVGACGRIGFDPATRSTGDAAQDGVTIPTGQIAWYPLHGPDGLFVDMVGGHDGACSAPACPTTGPGRQGTAAQFDGIDDCLQVADVGQLQLPTLTIALWARQTTAVNQSQLAKPVGGANSWQLEASIAGSLLGLSFTTAINPSTNAYTVSPDQTIVVGAWQHLAATWDGARKRVYIDGAEVASSPMTSPLLYDRQPMTIGCDDNSGTRVLFYAGALEDVRLFDRAISPTEIAQLAGR